tara:strand:- start:495 stop:827 length:333 start_codon:yes stop_codon:yes gene_type:complete
MKDLTLSDYKDILYYYNVDFDKFSSKKIRMEAEDILSGKLCRCIKKVNVEKKDETRSIAICKDSVFKKKGLRISSFKCKKKQTLLPFKKTKKKLKKYNKSLKIRRYKKGF